METKRLWFKKEGMLKYISHLDFSRYMSRMLKMTGLPLWYTEGFNPHLHMVFTQPLSLGMTGECESLDVRITESVSHKTILEKLNQNLVTGLSFYAVSNPVMKPGEVAFASYDVLYSEENTAGEVLQAKFSEFAAQETVMIEKKSKSGSKPFDLAPFIKETEVSVQNGDLFLKMFLPAGSAENVNPRLIGDAFGEFCGCEIFQEIKRTGLFNGQKEIFK